LDVVRLRIQKAEHDIEAARRIMVIPEGCPFDTVCFHCQQAVEKYLKALLTLLGIPAPRTHALEVLHKLLPANSSLSVSVEALVELNPYAVQSRYADDWGSVEFEDAQRAFILAQTVRTEVLAALPPGVRPRGWPS
jgi:HEPN domain-containing protein